MAAVVALVLTSWCSLAAAQPTTLTVHGALRSGAGPVADGKYVLTFRLYTAEKDTKALYQELHPFVAVSGGMFAAQIGAIDPKSPLPASVFTGNQALWVGVQVQNDPELPRKRLTAVPYAFSAHHAQTATKVLGGLDGASLKAGSVPTSALSAKYAGADIAGGPAKLALGIQCTGCVAMEAVQWNKDLYLTKNAIIAAKVTADSVTTGSIAAGKFFGDGSGLTGLAVPKGKCKSGEMVSGINADGTLQCAHAEVDFSGDMLDKASHGTLSSAFIHVYSSKKAPFPIPDNNPKGITDTIAVPDLGPNAGLLINLSLTTSDLKQVTAQVTAPNGQKFVLVMPNTQSGTKVATSYPEPTKAAFGDFDKLIAANLKGTWTLQVWDNKYTNNKDDGLVESWSLKITTLSKSGLRLKGKMVVHGGIDHGLTPAENFRLADCKDPLPTCDAKRRGAMCSDAKTGAWTYCNGAAWIVTGSVEKPGDKGKPGVSCKALLAADKTLPSGPYWLDPTGSGKPFLAHCDMTTAGGGWTMCVTDNHEWRVRAQSAAAGEYGKDGYRTDCRDIAFSEILYVRHDNSQHAGFKRDNGQSATFRQLGDAAAWNVGGGTMGTFSPFAGVAKAGKYQAMLCDNAWMRVGLMVSGYTNCWKGCGSWCADSGSLYFRYDGDDGGGFNGVAFNENGHKSVGGKLMSVGIR